MVLFLVLPAWNLNGYGFDFTLQAGNSWTWQMDSDYGTTTAYSYNKKVAGYTVFLLKFSPDAYDGGSYHAHVAGQGYCEIGRDVHDALSGDYLGIEILHPIQPAVGGMNYGDPVGKTAQWQGYQLPEGGEIWDVERMEKETWEIAGYETVTVPYGTFTNAMKVKCLSYSSYDVYIENNQPVTAGDWNLVFASYEWYVPVVGMIQSQEISEEGDPVSNPIELVNCKVNGTVNFNPGGAGSQDAVLTTSVIGGHGTLSPASGSYNSGTVVHLTAVPDNGYQVKSWSGTDNNTLTTTANTVTMTADKTVTVEFEAIPDGNNDMDLSGEYWFGSLSADVSTNIPWGKRGTVMITGNTWSQEWDDQSGHHTFNSIFTTDVQPDGSIDINLSTGAYNVAWNGNVMIHADAAPDGNNRLGIDILTRKATNVSVNDFIGEYSFFGHWLGWNDRWDEVGWGTCMFNANGTMNNNWTSSESGSETDTGTWALDTINGIGTVSGVTPSFYLGQGGLLNGFRITSDAHSNRDYTFFIKKTSQTFSRAEMSDTYQVRFLESGPGGVPYTCGQGTIIVGADGTYSIDAYYSDGEHDVNNGSYTIGSGGKITFTPGGEGIISSDKRLILIPEMDRPSSPDPDDWIGGIFLIRAPSNAQQYQLTASVVGGLGMLSPSGGSYDSGTVVNLTATPEAGCWVKAWHGTDEDGLTTSANTVTMTADKTVTVEFEVIPEDALTISVFTVKAGKTRESHTDSLALRGTISPEFLSYIADSSNNLADITLGVYSQQNPSGGILQTLDASSITVDAKRTKIAYKSPAAQGQPSLIFTADLKKGAFSLTGKNLDLTGMQSPVAVELDIGNYSGSAVVHDGEASGSGGNPDLINGAKPMPVQFMVGYADTLRVDKCVFVLGTKKPQTDKLTVQGVLAAADPSVDIAALDVTVQWGAYSVVLPAADLIRLGEKTIFKYVKPKGAASPIAAALFDLEKCIFKIALANADIGSQGNPVDFAIQFGAFHESVTLPLIQKNQTTRIYP